MVAVTVHLQDGSIIQKKIYNKNVVDTAANMLHRHSNYTRVDLPNGVNVTRHSLPNVNTYLLRAPNQQAYMFAPLHLKDRPRWDARLEDAINLTREDRGLSAEF